MGTIKKDTKAQVKDQARFDALQAARRKIKNAHRDLLAAHMELHDNAGVAHEMADGDVRSICGLPAPRSSIGHEESARPKPEGGFFKQAVANTVDRYERGLDCAGAHADALYFGHLDYAMKHQGQSAMDALLDVADRYGRRNGNAEVLQEFLEAAIGGAREDAREETRKDKP